MLGYGYSSFAPWDLGTFFSYYAMAIFAIAAYSGWKIVMRSRIVKVEEIDLVWERPTIDAYEAVCEERPVGFWRENWGMARWRGNGHSAEA
jgi:amino acid transporter